MKKIFTFFVVALFSCSLMAQQPTTDEAFHFDGYAPINQKALQQRFHTKPAKDVQIGWMIPSWNLLDYFYMDNTMVSHYANVIFPDSTPVYESGGVTKHNWLCSVGGVFDPTSIMYDSLQLAPLVTSSKNYRIDSILVLAWYNVVSGSVTDTLVIELVNGLPTVAPEFAWSVFNYPTDTFNVSPPKVLGSATETGYLCRMTASSKTVIKYPLTLTDSTNIYGKYIIIPVNYSVPAGNVTGVSVTYVPGTSYQFGDMLYSYSNTVTPVLNSFRMGLYSTDDVITNPFIFADPYYGWNSHHYINSNIRYSLYTGSNAWRNERMASTMSWGFDLGYYVTNTGSGSGIHEANAGETIVYPNPATDVFNIDLYQPSDSYTRIEVTDILGRQVANLYEGDLGSGNHKFVWNISDARDAIYLLKIRTADAYKTVKLITSQIR